jgi:hypothetical protein
MRTLTLITRPARRIGLISAMVCVFVISANAYTVIMHDGRRLEIPSGFVVTASTLTYEVQPGIQVTLQMAAIDITATEKANGEARGALLKRAQSPNAVQPIQQPRSARKTITNRDLDAVARRRKASEAAYDKRLKELGLPSVEIQRKRADAESSVAQTQLHERLVAEQATEDYWRNRAQNMRTEIAALDAEINYVRMKLEEPVYSGFSGSYSSFSSVVPFISFGSSGSGRHFPGPRPNHPGVYSAPVGVGPQIMTGNTGTRGRVFTNPIRPGPAFGRHSGASISVGGGTRIGVGLGIWPYSTVNTSAITDYSYVRSALVTRFNELSAARAGMTVRWRELEDEAHRAGVPPGWLRR